MFQNRLVLVLLALASIPSFAADNQTQATVPARNFIDVGLNGWVYGNSLNNWNGRRAQASGTSGDPVQIINQLPLTFTSDNKFSLTVMPQFALQPFEGDRFQLLDPTVGMSGVVYSSGGFTYWARFENAIPLTGKSRADGLLFGPGAVNVVTYQFPRSGFMLKAVLVPSINFYSNGESSGFIYFSPSVNYIFNEQWMGVVLLETYTKRARKQGWFNLEVDSPTNLGFGFRYTLNNKLWIQPFLNIFPASAVTASSAHVAVMFGGQLN